MKIQAIKLLEGKCSICGYDKCIDALEFHHKAPKEKNLKLAQEILHRGNNTNQKF